MEIKDKLSDRYDKIEVEGAELEVKTIEEATQENTFAANQIQIHHDYITPNSITSIIV